MERGIACPRNIATVLRSSRSRGRGEEKKIEKADPPQDIKMPHSLNNQRLFLLLVQVNEERVPPPSVVTV